MKASEIEVFCYDVPMVKFINYINEEFEQRFEADISGYYKEVRKLLPILPENIKIYFMSGGIIHGMHTGGFAYSPEIISIAIDSSAIDFDDLRMDLRASVFHEAYHVAHNYTGQTGPFSLLENAIQEGSATLFEIKYADSKSKDLYGNYQQHTTAQLKGWFRVIEKVKDTRAMSTEENRAIAFYDKSDNIRWKTYKTGTWLVEEYITKINKDIKDFTNEDVKLLINSVSKSSKLVH